MSKPSPTPFEDTIDKSMNLSKQEDQYVHQVYEEIACHFSNTRYKPWPVIENFLKELQDGSIGIDAGCGNGKYMNVNKNVMTLGSDRSFNLIDICKQRDLEALVADVLALPFKDNAFDFGISVAVIHHLTSHERRIQAVKELIRVVKPKGRILVYVWALEQEGKRQFDPNVQDVLVPWVLNKTYNEDQKDKVVHRYYHLFKQGELQKLILDTNQDISIVNHGYDKDNWYVEMVKN